MHVWHKRVRVAVLAVQVQELLNILSVCIIALAIRLANRVFTSQHYVVIRDVCDSTVFFHIIL